MNKEELKKMILEEVKKLKELVGRKEKPSDEEVEERIDALKQIEKKL